MAREHLPNGTIVGGYEIIKPLSEGGSCLVYSVKNKEGKYFVLKEYYPKRWNRTEKEFETDFIREGLILKSKKETRIEKLNAVFDSEIKFLNEISFAEYNGKINNELGAFRAYKVTELEECFAGTLAQYMIIETASGEVLAEHFGEKEETVSYIKSVSKLMIRILYHLRQIHSKGILHLDLTPGNVYVCRIHEAEYLPIIIDFGSALNATKDENGLLIAESTCDVHTKSEGFSAPEITLSLNSPETTVITAQADIYSIGAIIYKLLTDESFSTEKIYEWNIDGFVNLESYLFDKISEKFKDILPGVKIKLVNILTKCLEKEVGKRYRNCDELIEELKTLVEIIEAKGFHPEVIFDKASDCASKFNGEIEQEILADVSAEKEEPKIFKNINGNSALTDAYKAFCYEKENRNAIVVSEGGAGKTYACRNSVCQFLREYIETNGESPIPLYIPAFKVETNIKAYINTNFIGSTDEQIEKGLSELFGKHSNTKLIIFIDGLNEISDNEQKEKIIDEIKGLIEEYPQISFIVTTRNEYDEGRIAKTETFSLLKLSEETVEKYVGHNVKDEIKKIIRNPLLLTVYVKTGSDIYKYADKQGYSILTAPGKETVTTAGELLWNFNQSHIVKLGGEYDRDSTSVSEAEDVLKIQYALEVILPAVAYLMVTNGKYSLSFKELKKYIETGTTQLQSFDGLDEFEEIAIPAKWMLKSLSNFGLIIYDKKEHSYKNIRIYHETILNFYCALHLRNLLKYDSDAAYEAFSSFAFSDEILRILGEICGNQYFEFENKNRNAETAGFEPIKIYSFDEKEYMVQKESLIGSLIEKCRNRFDNAGAECVRNLITAVEFSAKEICGWDLSYLDFSKSYLERTKLSNYDSYSVFDYSNFSRETFEGITREEFEGQNWVYNEETDTFIGETLQINAKTGWVKHKKENSVEEAQNLWIEYEYVEDISLVFYLKIKITSKRNKETKIWYFDRSSGKFFKGEFIESFFSSRSFLELKKSYEELDNQKGPETTDAFLKYYLNIYGCFGNSLLACITNRSGKNSYVLLNLETGNVDKFSTDEDDYINDMDLLFDGRNHKNDGETGREEYRTFCCNNSEPLLVYVINSKNPNILSPSNFLKYDKQKKKGEICERIITFDFAKMRAESMVMNYTIDSEKDHLNVYKAYLKEMNSVLFWYKGATDTILIFDCQKKEITYKTELKDFISFDDLQLIYFDEKIVFIVDKRHCFELNLNSSVNGILELFDSANESKVVSDKDMVTLVNYEKICCFKDNFKTEIKLRNIKEIKFYSQNVAAFTGHLISCFKNKISVCNLSDDATKSYTINNETTEKYKLAGFDAEGKTVSLLMYGSNDYAIKKNSKDFIRVAVIGACKERSIKTIEHKYRQLKSFLPDDKNCYLILQHGVVVAYSHNFYCSGLPMSVLTDYSDKIKVACDTDYVCLWDNDNQYLNVYSTKGIFIEEIDLSKFWIVSVDDEVKKIYNSVKNFLYSFPCDLISKSEPCLFSDLSPFNDSVFEKLKFEACGNWIFITSPIAKAGWYVDIAIRRDKPMAFKSLKYKKADLNQKALWHFAYKEKVYEAKLLKDSIIVTDLDRSGIKTIPILPTETYFKYKDNLLFLKTDVPGKIRVINVADLEASTLKKYIYIDPVDVFGCTFNDTKGIPEETKNRMKQYGAEF